MNVKSYICARVRVHLGYWYYMNDVIIIFFSETDDVEVGFFFLKSHSFWKSVQFNIYIYIYILLNNPYFHCTLVNTSRMLTKTEQSFTNITELWNGAVRVLWMYYSIMKNKFPFGIDYILQSESSDYFNYLVCLTDRISIITISQGLLN